jgi:hypothetical protein
MPSAMSSISEPVGTTSTISATRSPMRMTEPLPNCFSIWLSAADRARFLFSSIVDSLVVSLGRRHRKDCDCLHRDGRTRIEFARRQRRATAAEFLPRRGESPRGEVAFHRFGLTRPQYRPSIANSCPGCTSIGA